MIPIGLAIFIIAVAITRYVSVGSLFVAWYIPVNTLVFHWLDGKNPLFLHMMILSLLFTVLAYVQHRQNIVRLFHGAENKMGAKKEEREKIILDTLSQVGMAPMFLDRYPHQLSGGQRQRIIIARCLVVTPKIIFADEPISALDVSLQAQVINMLMDLQDKYKLSMLLIAHDLAVVRQIADQIKIMYFGEIVESAPSSEIYKNAQHPYTKVLLKAAPSISKGLEDAGFDIDLKPGDIPDPAKPMPGCPFCTRCIYADERCMKERPEETEVSPGHTVRCHKAGQI